MDTGKTVAMEATADDDYKGNFKLWDYLKED